MQRQPTHDFEIVITKETDNAFVAKLTIPEDFQRPHLGSVNIIKVAIESIVEINFRDGLEEKYSKKLLGEFFLRLGKEITDFSRVEIALTLTRTKERNGKLWQKWDFFIDTRANNGYIWACYLP